jgi:ABC-2 type transport system ATP-binding protein
MDAGERAPSVLSAEGLSKEFAAGPRKKIKALDDVSITVERGAVTGLLGPDGAGKTTFIRLAAGLLFPDAGSIRVLGIDVQADPQAVQSRVGYMPQRFGLYEDLTVQENLDLYADLHGVSSSERSERYPELMHMTGLGRFTGRLAGRLSGGMKQKLGLACTLVRSPDLLLLDEPTVGVDPLSRRELWEIVYRLVREQGLTVLLSTSYLDEAERCDTTIVLLQGKVLASGPPSKISGIAEGRSFRIDTPQSLKPRQLQASLVGAEGIVDATLEGRRVRFVTSSDNATENPLLKGMIINPAKPRFEDGFMTLLHRTAMENPMAAGIPDTAPAQPGVANNDEVMVEVHDLVKRFGTFYAVKNVTFEVRRGEIFGLLGPNGAGKSTTFRMLCGLLPASEGTLSVAGLDLRTARASARQRIGYVAQKFSLYGQLTVMENLEFFAGAYGLRRSRRQDRIKWAFDEFDLSHYTGMASGQLPGGYKQRLAMACALMHEPEILFLDEPTSGVDPLARREFWYRISRLADQGVTVIVTTHFMEEAEYCDNMVIMVDGEILATGTPADIRGRARIAKGREPTIEDAFIAIVEDHRTTSGDQAA